MSDSEKQSRSDRQCSRGHREKPVNGICLECARIALFARDPVPAEVHLSREIIESKGSDFFPGVEEQG